MKKTIILAFIAFALAASGCGKGADTAVIARIGRSKITMADFKRQMEKLPPKLQDAVMTDAQARKEFLDDLIGIEVVLQEARRQGLDRETEYAKKQERLRKEMERSLQDEMRDELFNSLLKKELMGKIPQPTDSEVKEYYAKHRDEIKKAAGGRDISLKEAETRGLKSWLYTKKQRDAYVDYAKGLRKNAKIDIDEKALNAVAASLSAGSPQEAPRPQSPAASAGTGTAAPISNK